MNNVTPSAVPLRVGFFQAYPGRLYGSQRFQLYLMEGVGKLGIEPVLLVTADGPVAEAGRAAGIPVVVVPPPPPLDRYGRVLLTDGLGSKAHMSVALATYTARLSRVLRREGLQVFHANDARAALLGGWAARAVGVPMVWHHHTDEGDELPRRPFALAYHLAERVVTCADGTAGALLRVLRVTPPGKLHVVHNGVPAVATPSGPAGPPHIGVVASLVPRKGHHILIRAFADVVAAIPEAELVVAGDPGPVEGYPASLHTSAEKLGLASKVRFLGYVDQSARVYAGLRVFCLPSLEDALPLAILEAMAMGLPVVSTTVGGIPEMVDHGRTGLLVPPGDAPALAQALTAVLRDPSRGRAMGVAGRDRVQREFTLQTSGRAMAEHFHAAAGRYRRRRSRPTTSRSSTARSSESRRSTTSRTR